MGMTATRIGPAFPSELAAAGLRDGIGWSEDGTLFFGPNVSQATRDAAHAVLDSHDPNTPAPPVVPEAVTRYQAEVYMRRIGIWDAADALFADMPDDDERKIAWLRAPTFERESPALNFACDQMGITPEQRDTMFIEASGIL